MTINKMQAEEKYPRILIVASEPLSQMSATGITVSNLFRGWPRAKLAQIYTADMVPDDSMCTNYWRLSSRNIYGLDVLARARCYLRGRRTFSADAGGAKVQKIARSGGRAWLRRFAPILDFLPYRVPEEIHREVVEFRPDAIYSLLGSLRVVRLVQDLSDELGVPVVPHFMDDWLTTYSSSEGSLGSSYGKRLLPRLTQRLMGNAPLGLAISDDMSEEYSIRFQVPFSSFMNPAELHFDHRDSRLRSSGMLKLVYVGGLHLGRHTNLIAIAEAVQEMRKESARIVLHIYVPPVDFALASSCFEHIDGVVIKGSISPDQVGATLCEYDMAVHVESFLPAFSEYTRLSISTKIPQYLAAGLPIFACGPRDVASCKYIDRYACGRVVGSLDLELLIEELRALVINESERNLLAKRAIYIARQRHDAGRERLRFMQTLVTALGIQSAIGCREEAGPQC